MATFHGEPYPGFFQNHEAIAKEAHEDAKKHFAVAESFAFTNGEETKPEIGCMYMYDYAHYVYDGRAWVPIAAEQGPENPEDESPNTVTMEITGLTDGDDMTIFSAEDNTAASVTQFKISDGSNFQQIDIAEMAEDIASMKEMIQQLMGNKTSPAPDENMCDDPEYAQTIALAYETDTNTLRDLIEESEKENDYDRAMGIVK